MLQTLDNADCITEFTVSSTNFDDLFYVKLNTNDISNIDLSNVLFKINYNNNPFDNIDFSKSNIKYGSENVIYRNQKIYVDMVRHIAKDITGGYAVADIFSNESELANNIVYLDNLILQDISNTLHNVSILTINGISNETINTINNESQLRFLKCISKLFEITVSDILNNESSYNSRTLNFLNDISNYNLNDYIPIKFIPGDAITIYVSYDPKSNTFNSDNSILSRSYKILISFT
jgi:hypothetical protein|tara:strand:- start:1663 stop:2367 length:705 start_codon:yes stop_codon:yes gene_type:complete